MTRKLARGRGSLIVGVLLAASCLLRAERASAEEKPAQCLAAYEDAQVLRRQGDLVSSAQQLLACGGPACPVRMQRDCQRWWDEVQRSLPTVVFRVRGPNSEALANATIAIDGAPARALDGRAVQMNPGQHEVVFAHSGYAPLRTPVFITEGEKLEPHDIALAALGGDAPAALGSDVPAALGGDAPAARGRALLAPASRDEGPSSHVLPTRRNWTGPIAAGAIAALGGVGLAYFGSSARGGEDALERCTPGCGQGSIDGVKRDYLWANVSLGVGVAALLGAGLILLLDDGGDAAQSAASGPRPSTTFGVVRF
ncbi:MAG: hypothetical protein RL033_3083 [Pseudomonadota bacterium]|jgi:hypothetical protein